MLFVCLGGVSARALNLHQSLHFIEFSFENGSMGKILSVFKPIGMYKSYTVLLFHSHTIVTAQELTLNMIYKRASGNMYGRF